MLRLTPILGTLLLFGCITINKHDDDDDDDGSWGDDTALTDPSSPFGTGDDPDGDNATPTATITSHTDGDLVTEGDTITFVGTASDNDDDTTTLSVVWYSDDVELCSPTAPASDGTTTCTAVPYGSNPTIQLEVRDPSDSAAVDSVTLVMVATEAPWASITSPSSGDVLYSDQPTVLEGVVADTEDSVDALVVQWQSSIDGDLASDSMPDSTGRVLSSVYLSEGSHDITLTATDSSGKQAQDSVYVEVGPANSPPTCEILSPEDGSVGTEGTLIEFISAVSDVDVSVSALDVLWSSDMDGVLGSSTPTSDGIVSFSFSDLSAGTHVISMSVTDEIGASCTHAIVYTVGTAPTITITSPEASGTYSVYSLIEFSGTVEDGEDRPEDITIAWASSAGGDLTSVSGPPDSTGTFSRTGYLTEGEHALTVTATDSTGLTNEDSVIITVHEDGGSEPPP